MTDIFLSWSGKSAKRIGQELRRLLPVVLHGSAIFMSDKDIEKGKKWKDELDDQLQKTQFGMFILTPENVVKKSDWMAYEAGSVITKKDKNIRVFTLLFEVNPTSMPNYLQDFQFSAFEKEEWKQLLLDMSKSIKGNTENNDQTLVDDNFETMFDLFWRAFDEQVKSVLKEAHSEHINKSKAGSNQKKEKPPEIINEDIRKTMRELSGFVVKIPSIETKLNDLSNRFMDFQSRLTPPLRESGLLTSEPHDLTNFRMHRNSSITRLKNIISNIERDGLLDDASLNELKSAINELM